MNKFQVAGCGFQPATCNLFLLVRCRSQFPDQAYAGLAAESLKRHNRESHDIEVAALDAVNEERCIPLYAVGACLVPVFACL